MGSGRIIARKVSNMGKRATREQLATVCGPNCVNCVRLRHAHCRESVLHIGGLRGVHHTWNHATSVRGPIRERATEESAGPERRNDVGGCLLHRVTRPLISNDPVLFSRLFEFRWPKH